MSAKEFVGINTLVRIDQGERVEDAVAVMTRHEDEWTMQTVALRLESPVTQKLSPRVVRFRNRYRQTPIALLSSNDDEEESLSWELERESSDLFQLTMLMPGVRFFGQSKKDQVVVGEIEKGKDSNIFMSLFSKSPGAFVDPFHFQLEGDGEKPVLFHITEDGKLFAATLTDSNMSIQVVMQFAEYPRQ